MTGIRTVDGHPAHGIEEDDVLEPARRGDRPGVRGRIHRRGTLDAGERRRTG
ncbi:MAG: hypothetical protein IVW53_00755 [Chloroflexi bacterium]|nr:hypothetical protein [Chloroflexota bacterium]